MFCEGGKMSKELKVLFVFY